MPAISVPAKVLVTGANGFLAVWIIKELLEKGYTVYGTVRALEKGAHISELFKDAVVSEKLKLVVVPDVLAAGALDNAVVGVDAIVHAAAELSFRPGHPDELIVPAVKGAKSVLNSALKYGDRLKRFVFTSSFGAVTDDYHAGAHYDENSWNDASYEDCLKNGEATSPMSKYRASKAQAEKALWEFHDQTKGKRSWDIVSLCIPGVIGPMLHEPLSSSRLNASNMWFYDMFINKSVEETVNWQGPLIDVRDASEAHVRALEKAEAGNERLLLIGWISCAQDWYDAFNGVEIPGAVVRKGTPRNESVTEYRFTIDDSKARSILNMQQLRERSDTVKAFVGDLRSRAQS